MQLICMRHAEPMPATATCIDPGLSQNGRDALLQVSQYISQFSSPIEKMYCSDKQRAVETADGLLSSGYAFPAVETLACLHPSASFDAMCDGVQSLGASSLVISHNPHITQLVSYLLTGSSDKSVFSFTPGAAVSLQLSNAHSWSLNWAFRPS